MNKEIRLKFKESGHPEYPCSMYINDKYVDDWATLEDAVKFVGKVIDGDLPEPDSAEEVVYNEVKETADNDTM